MKPQTFTYFFLLIFFTNIFTTLKAKPVNINDSLALVDIYNSTNGPNWKGSFNWLTSEPVRLWGGVTVKNGRVINLNLSWDNLSGTLPASIGNLKKLEGLDLSTNDHLSGSIPSTIGNLINLKTLYLYDDSLTGSIPSTIGNLVNLEKLSLHYNWLTGPLPLSIGNLSKLIVLDISLNELSGSIPPTIDKLLNIGSLDLNFNQLSGSIPTSISQLVNLQKLNLSRNQLSGSIPFSIGKLVILKELYLYQNQLSGSIPSSIGNLVQLLYIDLGLNLLSGRIPSSIGNLTSLVSIGLDNNQLSGNIPYSFSKLTNCTSYDFSSNQLTGNLPDSFLLNLNHSADVSLNNNHFKNITNTYPAGYLYCYHLNVSNNDLNFNGIEWLATQDYQYNKFAYKVMYTPQANITIRKTVQSLSVDAGGTLSNNTYTWFRVGSQESTTVKGDSVFHPAQDGDYYVQVTNSIAYRLTLNSDIIHYTTASLNKSIVTSINPKQPTLHVNSKMLVYPNPSKDIIHVKLNETAMVAITDAVGKPVFIKSISGDTNIDVSHFPNGTYYIQNRMTGETKKIMVMH